MLYFFLIVTYFVTHYQLSLVRNISVLLLVDLHYTINTVFSTVGDDADEQIKCHPFLPSPGNPLILHPAYGCHEYLPSFFHSHCALNGGAIVTDSLILHFWAISKVWDILQNSISYAWLKTYVTGLHPSQQLQTEARHLSAVLDIINISLSSSSSEF